MNKVGRFGERVPHNYKRNGTEEDQIILEHKMKT